MCPRELTQNQTTEFQKYKHPDPLMAVSLERAFLTTMDVLDSTEGKVGQKILGSYRRIMRLRNRPNKIKPYLDDIQFDLASFEGIQITGEEIMKGLSAVIQLAYAYYEPAQIQASKITRSSGADEDFCLLVAQETIDNFIFYHWRPKEKSFDSAMTLQAMIRKRLSLLEKTVYWYGIRDKKTRLEPLETDDFSLERRNYAESPLTRRVGVFDIDNFIAMDQVDKLPEPLQDIIIGFSLGYTEIEIQKQLQVEKEKIAEAKEQYRKLLYENGIVVNESEFPFSAKPSHIGIGSTAKELRFIIDKLTLAQLFILIEKLDPREQLALMVFLKYSENNRHYGKKGQREAYYSDLALACSKLELLLERERPTVNLNPTRTIRAIVDAADNQILFRMNNRLAHFDSSRIQLVKNQCRINKQLLAKLTNIELSVLLLATEIIGEKFAHSSEEIAASLKISVKTVDNILIYISRLNQNNQHRFVNRDNVVIRETSLQYALIVMFPSLTRFQLCALSPIQQDILRFITSSDKQGRYPSIQELADKFHFKDRKVSPLFKIPKSLELAKEIESLEKMLIKALGVRRDLLSETEYRIIIYLFEKIKQGAPLRGSQGGIGWTELSRQLGLPEHICRNTINVWLPHKLERIQVMI